MRLRAHGASLIELMIGLVIVGVTVSMAVPSFGEWIKNSQIRTMAESIQAGLNLARTEAIRLNTPVRFQLTDSLTSGCALSTSGTNWIVNLTSSTSPASSCNSAPSTSTSPFILQSSPPASTKNLVVVSASQSVVSFNGLGRQTASTTPTAAVATATIDLSPSSGTCLASSGTLRCLRIVVTAAGQIRMCDPSFTSTTSDNDAMAC